MGRSAGRGLWHDDGVTTQRSGTPTVRPPLLDAVRGRRVARSMVVDVALVLVFVAIGRRNHDQATALGGVADTAAPFLVALLPGWLAVVLARMEPTSVRAGAMVVASAIVLGMAWRAAFTDAATPVAFVLVATGFLTLFLLGWRLVALLLRRAAARP